MAWLSRVNFIASDTLSFSDINNLGNDIRAWGGNVNGGGYVLSNVVLSAFDLSTCFGLPISTGVSGLGTGVATFLGTPSSANLAAAITNETGTGALVFGTSPTLVTPTITTSAVIPLVIGGTAVGSNITYKSTTGAGTSAGIAHQFVGGTDGATVAATILNNGNYGIGTTSPAAKLDIFGSSQLIRCSGTTAQAFQGFYKDATRQGYIGTGTGGDNLILNSDFDLLFQAGGNEKMRILTGGNVGIGTASPFTILHTEAATNTSTTAFGNFGVAPAAVGQLHVKSSNAFTTQLGGRITLGGNTAASGSVGNSIFGAIEGFKTNATTANAGGGMYLKTTVNATGALTTVLTVTGEGNVGIGLAPAYLLDIYRAATAQMRIYNSTASGYSGVLFGTDANAIGSSLQLNSSALASYGGVNSLNLINIQNAPLALGANNAVAATILGNGNVGIGTTPGNVFSAIYAAPKTIISASDSNTGAQLSSIGQLVLVNPDQTTGNTAALQFAHVGTNGNVYTNTSIGAVFTGARGTTYSASDLVFTTGPASNGNTERVRITSAGNVGIGTTSPNSKLTIIPATNPTSVATAIQLAIGESTNNTGYRLNLGYEVDGPYKGVIDAQSGGSGTTLLINPSGGSVGIGTTSPATLLHLLTSSGTITPIVRLDNQSFAGSEGGAIDFAYSQTQPVGARIRAMNDGAAGANLTMWTKTGAASALSERMRIDSTGNVGIGLTNPVYQLQVNTDSAGKPGVGGLWTVVSDERIKTDITPADLDRCYEIVKSVPLKHFGFAPGVYTDDQIQDKHSLGWIAQDVQKVFSKAVSVKPFTLKTAIPDGAEEYTEQDFTLETVEKTETSIQVIDGKPVQVSKVVTSENKVLLFDSVDVVDEAGAVVMDGDKPLTYQMPRMVTKTRNKVRHDVIEDCLDLNGGQMIAALYGAVQALMLQVESLKAGN